MVYVNTYTIYICFFENYIKTKCNKLEKVSIFISFTFYVNELEIYYVFRAVINMHIIL